HIQIEMDLINWTHDRFGGGVTDSLAFAPVNFKIGLTNNVDLQLVYDSYAEERTRVPGHRTHVSGWGDLTTRLKINLWGNDGGETAFALMPFVKFPTSQDHLGNDAVESGVIFPLAIALPHEWNLGVMTELDVNQDSDGRGHHAEF